MLVNRMRCPFKLNQMMKNVLKNVSDHSHSRRIPQVLQTEPIKRQCLVVPITWKRMLRTTSVLNDLPFGIPSPSLILKKTLLKRIVYPDFDEKEFLRGAKGAISYVSYKLSRGELDELKPVFTEEAWEHIRQLYNQHEYPEMFFIESDDMKGLRISDLDFKYEEDEEIEDRRKHVRILVRFDLPRKLREINPTEDELDEDWEKIKDQVRVWTTVKYSFIRDVTPGVAETSDWIIEFMSEGYRRR